jgi:short chain dehydrogenase
MQVALDGRRAIVTGSTPSSSNIGYAIAKGLAQAGAAVVVNGRSSSRVDDAVERLRAEVPRAEVIGVAADLTDASEIERMIDAVPQADVLVNNLVADGGPCTDVVESKGEARIVAVALQHVRSEEGDVELPSSCGEPLPVRPIGESFQLLPVCERRRAWIEADAVVFAGEGLLEGGDLLVDAATTLPRADVRVREVVLSDYLNEPLPDEVLGSGAPRVTATDEKAVEVS